MKSFNTEKTEADITAVVQESVATGAILVTKENTGYCKDLDEHFWEVAFNAHFRVEPNEDA